MHGASLFQRGYSCGGSGNISAKLDDGILISPTSSCLGRLDPGRISKVSFAGEHLAGDKPSKEIYLHVMMYEQRPDAGAGVPLSFQGQACHARRGDGCLQNGSPAGLGHVSRGTVQQARGYPLGVNHGAGAHILGLLVEAAPQGDVAHRLMVAPHPVRGVVGVGVE